MLHITSLFASILALLILYLAFKVVVFRRSKKVGIGANGDEAGLLAIRTHANATEYIPIFLILMGIYEINGGSATALYIIGVLSLVARFIHVMGLSKSAGVSFGRLYGTALTWILIIVLAGLNIVHFLIQ
jgi:uncharacterized membrane protein YecN with MAPEG domain